MFRHRCYTISCLIPLLSGAASLYALNTANLRALETILCVLSMIDGEEGRCLAMATKPNKNLNSSRFDRGGAYGLLQDTLPSRVQATPIELVHESTSCIYKVKAPLITVCRFRASLPVCRYSNRHKRGFSFQHRLLRLTWGNPSEPCRAPCAWRKHDRWIISDSSQKVYFSKNSRLNSQHSRDALVRQP